MYTRLYFTGVLGVRPQKTYPVGWSLTPLTALHLLGIAVLRLVVAPCQESHRLRLKGRFLWPTALVLALSLFVGDSGLQVFAAHASTSKPTYQIVELTLRGEYPDQQAGFSLFGAKQSYPKLLTFLRRIEQDPQVKAVIVRLSGLQVGMAKALGISQALARLHKAGKITYALLETATTADYIAALGCEKIAMLPGAMLYMPGVRAEALYFKKFLDHIGMSGDFITIGDFKTAPEPFTRNEMSDAQRQQLGQLVDSLYSSLTNFIREHRQISTQKAQRKLSESEVQKAIDRGLHDPESAMAMQLIDLIIDRLDLRTLLLKQIPQRPLVVTTAYGKKTRPAPTNIWSLFSMFLQPPKRPPTDKKPKIAVYYATGQIYYGSPPAGWWESEPEIWSDRMIKTLDDISKLPDIKAIVLRINSPGGSALASDAIWYKLEQLKQKLPIFVSMGDIAASGGYYIAMGANAIVAQPTTITGSIGVFGGKLVMRQTLDKIGINVQTVARGKNSGIFSPFAAFSVDERRIIEEMLQQIYGMFTQKAAKGRNLPLAQLLKLASGRVWSGQQAQQNGLIDQLGGLQDTIDLAIKRTDLKVEPTIVSYPRPRSFFESLQEISSNTPRQLPYTPAQALSAISHLPLAYVHAIKPLLLASNSPLLAWHPLPHIKW